jgi:hypothetical protein
VSFLDGAALSPVPIIAVILILEAVAAFHPLGTRPRPAMSLIVTREAAVPVGGLVT